MSISLRIIQKRVRLSQNVFMVLDDKMEKAEAVCM